MATSYESLIPRAIANEIVSSLGERASAVMALSRTIRMPSGDERVAVVSAPPQAGFVNPAFGGRKPASAVEWTPADLTAEELAVVVSVPNAFLDDTTYPVWASVRDEVTGAFASVFDAAALYATAAPASFPAGGLTAPAWATAVSAATGLAALDAAIASLEADGVVVDGILGGGQLRALIRSEMVVQMATFAPQAQTLWGIPVSYSSVWDDSKGLALVGGWQSVLVGLRQTIRFEMSTDGVLTDAAGAIIVNAFQDDSTLMRSYLRAALTATKPVGPAGAAVASLALASVTGGAATAASKAKG